MGTAPSDRSGLHRLSEVLAETEEKLERGETAAPRVWPTGFPTLDTYLGGGLRSGELAVLGGPEGVGKTSFALQVLRQAVVAGASAVYFSFEQGPSTVLERLIALEAADTYGLDALPLRRIREAFEGSDRRTGPLARRLANTVGGVEAVQAVGSYSDRLLVHRSSGTTTDPQGIAAVVDQARHSTGSPPLVVVDYLQKVPVPGRSEEDRITVVAESLKDLALGADVPVLAVSASDLSAADIGARRRLRDLRGSSALAAEADVVLLMNDKYDVVARHHLVYDVGHAERFRDWVVVSIEKNRSGLDHIDLEFRKRFEQGRFEADGHPVQEQLVDERVFRG